MDICSPATIEAHELCQFVFYYIARPHITNTLTSLSMHSMNRLGSRALNNSFAIGCQFDSAFCFLASISARFRLG